MVNHIPIGCFVVLYKAEYANFEMSIILDCGSSIEELFPDKSVFEDNAAFKNVIDQIDLQTLGNAIFSQWRYFNHWNNAPMNEENYQWFVIAFSRLAELSE